MISCRTLGPVQVKVDGADPPPEILWRKNLALFIYLARSPKRLRTREHLTGLLWAEKPESSARHSLREAIRVIRRVVGDKNISAGRDLIRLADDAVQLDIDEFQRLEQERNWKAASELVGGEFLEGFCVPDSSGFEDWLATERLDWGRRTVAALVNLADQHLHHGRATESADVSLRALRFDAGSERALQAAMKALAIAGDRAAALGQYDQFTARMGELETEPSPETKTLAERVRCERTWRLPKEAPTDPTAGAESRRTPLVGRESELQRLTAVWDECLEARVAGVGFVEADAGLGKTRLVEELLSRARLDGAAVASVRAVAGDLEAPFSGVLGLASGGLLGASGVPGAGSSALASFAAEIPEWADRFGGARTSTAPFGRALTEVLHAIAHEQPVCLVVDDAQWVDRESLSALLTASRDLAHVPLFLLFALCPQPPRDQLDQLRSRIGRDVAGAAVRLTPLDHTALRQLCRWAVPVYNDAEVDRLARRVAADSAGLPLLAVELLHAVALGFDLGTIKGTWPEPLKTLEQTLPGDLPDAVVASIRIGFRRLSANAQGALTAAAVLGDRVDAEHLERGSGITGDTLFVALDELEWQRWLIAEPRGYSFLARIVRDVVERDMLTAGQRQRILKGVSN